MCPLQFKRIQLKQSVKAQTNDECLALSPSIEYFCQGWSPLPFYVENVNLVSLYRLQFLFDFAAKHKAHSVQYFNVPGHNSELYRCM